MDTSNKDHNYSGVTVRTQTSTDMLMRLHYFLCRYLIFSLRLQVV